MLPAAQRMRRSQDFGLATRRGVRAARGTLVVHLWHSGGTEPARIGFVVSKAVGNAVARNRVKRRLRAIVASGDEGRRPGTLVVIRARPEASGADTGRLRADLASAWAQAERRSGGSR